MVHWLTSAARDTCVVALVFFPLALQYREIIIRKKQPSADSFRYYSTFPDTVRIRTTFSMSED